MSLPGRRPETLDAQPKLVHAMSPRQLLGLSFNDVIGSGVYLPTTPDVIAHAGIGTDHA